MRGGRQDGCSGVLGEAGAPAQDVVGTFGNRDTRITAGRCGTCGSITALPVLVVSVPAQRQFI
ncbi:hypothetical protein [Sphaerisporangium fuscum]|uniref:hypothetical protein n=1 Tax=Sphaerisporangium fuscum TaxID=2835868 RepID=UPI001BDD628D|nr:hypothetical protein [Sphaerisporangium fuscum]